MSRRRRGNEFDQNAIDQAFRRANGRDEITGEPLGRDTEVDHIIPIGWALLLLSADIDNDNAPDIVPHLNDSQNARVLNKRTHKDRHRNFDEQEAWALVTFFRSIQRRLFG